MDLIFGMSKLAHSLVLLDHVICLHLAGRIIIRKYRPNASNESLTRGDDVTFSEFVRYLGDYRPGKYVAPLDAHWRPYSELCLPCLVSGIVGLRKVNNRNSFSVRQHIPAILRILSSWWHITNSILCRREIFSVSGYVTWPDGVHPKTITLTSKPRTIIDKGSALNKLALTHSQITR